jgi:lipoprotein-releasing system ATP-binding protein
MLAAKNIHKSFKDLHVLKGVDLELKTSEILSIVGKSGTGKSTLLHILGTLDQADEGTLEIGGQMVSSLSKRKLAHFRSTKIGFVFQFHHLLEDFNAKENVMIPAIIAKASRKKASVSAEHWLEVFGLQDRMHHRPNQLSGGEQQRVAVARALINQPDIILADEPSGNLDIASSEELHDLLFKLRDEYAQSFIIVTHNMSLAERSNRYLTMKDGILI